MRSNAPVPPIDRSAMRLRVNQPMQPFVPYETKGCQIIFRKQSTQAIK
jgi:hypothetical protein